MRLREACAVALLATIAVVPSAACRGRRPAVPPAPQVKSPVVAGTFYPADARELRSQVEKMLAEAPDKKIDGRLFGLIAPHAGYMYSGRIAAAAFRHLKGSGFERAVVMAPSHRVPFRGAALLPHDRYRTPLGEIPIDRRASDALAGAHAWAEINAVPFEPEHSLEVMLPFLQSVLGDFSLVPIIIGASGKEQMDRMAEALIEELDDGKTIFVASSDLSHFHGYEEARERDKATIEKICAGSPDVFFKAVDKGGAELCGERPVYVMMRMAQMKNAGIELLAYANSGDVTGDRSRVVGYASMSVTIPEWIGEPQKRALLKLSRETLEAHLAGKPLPPLPEEAALEEQGAAFVTLKMRGQLRGCMGNIIASGPLHSTVQEMTVTAASRDPRFPPVRPEELDEISIEVSVLTPPEELSDPMAVRVGTDGLILERGPNRGVFLPQVPVEQGWDKMRYLNEISLKAGLPPDAWRGAKLMRFQAIVFHEGE